MIKLSVVGVLFSLLLPVAHAIACDPGDLQKNLTWCMSDANKKGFGDIVVGACNKDAKKLHDGYWDCQKDSGVRDRYEACSAGEQIDNARAVGLQLHIYTDPAKCGF